MKEIRKRPVRQQANGEENSLDEAIESAADAIKAVYAEFNEWQIKWYRGVLRKTLTWSLFYLILLGSLTLALEEFAHLQPFHASETWRIAVTAFGAILSWATVFFDLYRATPPSENDTKKHLLEKNFNGHFSYLTFYIIYLFFVYWNACLVAELSWYYGYTHHIEFAWTKKLLQITYSASPLIGALGVSLAILFLKFNWFEPVWRREVLELYKSRGHRYFARNILFTHLNQTPLSIIDLTILKNRSLLSSQIPEFQVFFFIFTAAVVYFAVSTHVNFHFSGQYPYPFLRKLLGGTWKVEILFFSGIVVFLNLITALMMFFATTGYLA